MQIKYVLIYCNILLRLNSITNIIRNSTRWNGVGKFNNNWKWKKLISIIVFKG